MQIPANPSLEEVRRAFALLGPIVQGKAVSGQAVGTSETRISHGLGRIPAGWIEVSPVNGAATPKQSRTPDASFLYLIASSAVTPKLWVW